MEQTHEPQPPTTLPSIRHDGWTGEKIAIFCETLAETAVVAEACEAAGMGISGAYAARRRNPVFAAAWDAALSIARERLADTLLARSMEGNVEQIYREGVMVGENHFLDNRLGLQFSAAWTAWRPMRSDAKPSLPRGRSPAQNRPAGIDWTLAVDALRIGDDDAVARALALIEVQQSGGSGRSP